MLIDTHCHLNFKAFEGGAKKIAMRAKERGVSVLIVPGTDMLTSQKAVEIAQSNEDIYALVGIHPHHAAQYKASGFDGLEQDLNRLSQWLTFDKVRGIGEIGLDKHAYRESRYGANIEVSDELFSVQKDIFLKQALLAQTHKKTLVIHNREAASEIVELLSGSLHSMMSGYKNKAVFHCCEPELKLLAVAQKYGLFLGVDGDITYDIKKQNFIAQVPLEMLVLETDAPYILPEPLRSRGRASNEPANIPYIAQEVARIKGLDVSVVAQVTTQNACKLFGLPK